MSTFALNVHIGLNVAFWPIGLLPREFLRHRTRLPENGDTAKAKIETAGELGYARRRYRRPPEVRAR